MKRKMIAVLLMVMLFLAVLPASRNYAGTLDNKATVGIHDNKTHAGGEQNTKEKIGVVINDTLYFLRLIPAPDVQDPMGVPGPKIEDPIFAEPGQVVPETAPDGK